MFKLIVLMVLKQIDIEALTSILMSNFLVLKIIHDVPLDSHGA